MYLITVWDCSISFPYKYNVILHRIYCNNICRIIPVHKYGFAQNSKCNTLKLRFESDYIGMQHLAKLGDLACPKGRYETNKLKGDKLK